MRGRERESKKKLNPWTAVSFFSVVGWQAVKDNSSSWSHLLLLRQIKQNKKNRMKTVELPKKRKKKKSQTSRQQTHAHTHFEMEKACTKSVLSTFSKLKASSQKLKTRARSIQNAQVLISGKTFRLHSSFFVVVQLKTTLLLCTVQA